ncbi:MAG: hypothetical protein ACOVKL_00140, partial [Polynucleobacter sp.]
YAHVPGDIADRHHEALVAARELKALEPAAHMYPSTLRDFEHGEKADYAYSIEMGNLKTGEETVPLYALHLEVTK